MAGRVLKLDLPYIDQGERKIFPLEIGFVSQWVIREINKILGETWGVQNRFNRMSDIESEISALNVERPGDFRQKIKDLEEELTEVVLGIENSGGEEILHKRFEVLKVLLTDNGYKDETMFFDFDFWDRQVDPADIVRLLTESAWKDLNPDKKKAINAAY